MREDKFSKTSIILYACGLIPVIWLALLIAPSIGGGLPNLIKNLADAINHPFQISWCEDILKTVLILIFAYAMLSFHRKKLSPP